MGTGADFLNWITGDGGRLAVSGAIGGLVRYMSPGGGKHWREGVVIILTGLFTAVFIGQQISVWISGSNEPEIFTILAVGYTSGVVGMSFSGFVIDITKAYIQSRKKP